MQTHRDSRLLEASRWHWRVLLACGLAATWWPLGVHAGDAEWLWHNPRPVGSSCTQWTTGDISFLGSQTGIAVGCGGTVLRTDDGGNTWIDASGNIEGTVRTFKSVSFIDSDTAVVAGNYVGGKFNVGDVIISRTEDGGATWTDQAADLPSGTALADTYFSDANSGIAVGGIGISNPNEFGQPIIIRTSDAGDTWTSTTDVTSPPLIQLNGVTCSDSTTCMAVGVGGESLEAGPFGPLILRSTDGGDTWNTQLYDTTVGGEFPTLYQVTCPALDMCLAIGGDGLIFKSTDGAVNWTPQDGGTTGVLDSISCRDALRCLVTGSSDGSNADTIVLRTDDGGDTWVSQLLEPPGVYPVVAFHGNTENATLMPGLVREGVTSIDGIAVAIPFGSTDGGVTWSPSPQFEGAGALGFRGLRAIEFPTSVTGLAVGTRGAAIPESEEPNRRWAEFPGALVRTDDGGNTWLDASADLPTQPSPAISDIVLRESGTGLVVGGVRGFIGPSTASVVCDEAFVARTTDGGAAWTDITSGVPEEFQEYQFSAVHFVDDDTGIVVGGADLNPVWSPTPPHDCPDNAPVILSTTDGGSSWTNQTPSGLEGYLTDVFFTDPANGVVVGRDGAVLTTSDGGDAWVSRPSGTSADLNAVAFKDDTEGWSVGKDVVLHTTDGGTTWFDVTPDDLPSDSTLMDIGFVDAMEGMIVGWVIGQPPGGVPTSYGVVLTTVDGGLTWEVEEGKATRVAGHYGLAPLDDGSVIAVGHLRGGGDDSGSAILRKYQGASFLPLSPRPPTGATCVPEDAPVEMPIYVGVGSVGGFEGPVQVASAGEPIGVSSVLEPSTVDAPGSSTWTLTVDSSVPPGQHVITLTGDDGEQQHFANFILNVVGSEQAPVPLGPADGATDVDLRPTFTWAAIPGVSQYRIQIATDPTFGDVVVDEEATGVSFTPAAELDSLTQYFWRVQGVYECLDDVWSEVFSFTTETKPQVRVSPSTLAFEVPLGSGDDSTVEIANVGTGDLVWSIDVELLPADGCAEAQWLTVSPDAGTTPADGSTQVIVTVDTAGLEVCDYTARLHIATNDTDHASVTVPVSLTVTGSELVFDPQSVDFGEVEAGHASPPAIVTLHSVGALDATGLEFQFPGAAFDVDAGACGATLPIGGQCEIIVVFTPPGLGPFSGMLEVHSDDGAIAFVSMSGQGVSETGIFVPMGLEVDTEPIISDANGVFEPGELAPVAPIWLNDGLFAQFLEGTASDLTGPEGPTYSLLAADADYGEVETGEMASCQESGLCYEMDIGPVGVTRPAPHWDATFDEALSDQTTQTWTLHLGDSFVDVPRNNLFYRPVETLLHSGVTDGCTSAEYCPASSNSRAQMAVFLLRAVEGGDYTPPACVADEEEFFDVPAGNVFCPWIEELATRGVTAGCGGGNYCPADSVTRAQMAVFLLKAAEGEDYVPPPCTGAFSDVLCPSTFAAWIEDLAARGITSGCSETEYCPATPVTRAQMASFLTRAFGLELYGP